jgi:hypothetical protein
MFFGRIALVMSYAAVVGVFAARFGYWLALTFFGSLFTALAGGCC